MVGVTEVSPCLVIIQDISILFCGFASEESLSSSFPDFLNRIIKDLSIIAKVVIYSHIVWVFFDSTLCGRLGNRTTIVGL